MKQSKKSWKVMAAIVIILSITFTTTLTSNAADLRNGSAFSFKLSDPKGKFNNGATISAHKKAFDTAYAKINASSSRIKLVRSGSGPTIRTRSTNKRDEWYGQMSGNSKEVQSLLINTPQPEINLIKQNYNKTALHEMGHAFGMKHQSSSSITVMKQGKYAYNDYTTLDKNNIKYKYGK